MAVNSGYVYAVCFDGDLLKVGLSKRNPNARIASHRIFAAENHGKHMTGSEVSSFHRMPKRTESALIDFCEQNYDRAFGGEWFKCDDGGKKAFDFIVAIDPEKAPAIVDLLDDQAVESMFKMVKTENSTLVKVNELHQMGNALRKAKGLGLKQVPSYFALDSTFELIEELKAREGLTDEQIKYSQRGKDGGTWVHPIVFFDMAMWYSAEVKIKVIKWAINKGIVKREITGTLEQAAIALFEANRDYFKSQDESARYIEDATKHESQLAMRDRIHNNIVLLADVMPSVPDCVNAAIEKAKKALIPKVI